MKRALITGITGQDSAYLAKSLLDKGYKVLEHIEKLALQIFGDYNILTYMIKWNLCHLIYWIQNQYQKC